MNNYLRNLKRNGAIYLATGAFAFNGCYDTQNNRAPQLILREAKTQQVVNATDERHIVNSESTYDKLYLIPMTRESLEQGLEQYIIEATDSDGPWPISGNFYTAQNRQLNPLQIHITEGRNTSESLSWTITLEPDQEETIPLGTYLVAEGSVSDGDKKRTVGIVCRPTNLSGKPNVPRSFKIITERARRIWPWVFYLSEREGFEPSVRFNPYTHFPGVLFKPLRHLSGFSASG